MWSLLCATLTELVDAPTAGVRHASEQAELGARLWRLLSAMVRPAFAAWSPAAAALFGLVRRLAVAQGRLPELVTLSLDLLAMMRNQHASSASAAAAAGSAGGAPSPGRRSASARAAAEAEASAAAEPQAVWLLVEFLQHVAVACRLPLPAADAGGGRRGRSKSPRLSATSQPSPSVGGGERGGPVVKMELAMNDAMNDAINDAMMEAEDGEGGDDDGVESYHEEDEPMGTDVEESLSDGMEVDAAADEAASERREWELACKLCTYASTGNSFTEQHWYYCYTCGLTESEGCCSICVKVCHKGHDVSYSRRSRFFCDCGAGAGATRGLSCSALAPRAFVPGEGGASQDSQTSQHACCARRRRRRRSSAAPAAPSPTPSAPVTDTSGGELVVSEAQRAELLAVLGEGGAGGFVASLYATYAWQLRQLQKAAPREAPADEEELFSTSKAASVSSSLVQPWTTVRAGSFDVKVKSEVAHHRELRTLLGTGVIARQLIAANGRGHIAIAEGEKIHVLDSAPAMGAPAAAAPVERGSLRATAKPSVGFEVLQLNFNSADETQLLVSGLKECVALTLGERGELVSRISIDLMLDALGLGLPVHILRTAWLPGSVSRCYVLTNQFIKVYDLAKDKICPQYYYQVLEDAIKDVAFAPTGADGTLTLLALTGSGVLYRQPLVAESGGGPLALCDAIPVPSELRGRVGASLHFSAPTGLLFASYADGKCFGLRLGGAATEVVGGFALHGARTDATASSSAAGGGPGGPGGAAPSAAVSAASTTPYLHWEDVAGQRGVLIATCRKTLLPMVVRVTPTALHVQPLRPAAKAEGLCAAALPSRAPKAAAAAAAAAARRRTSCGRSARTAPSTPTRAAPACAPRRRRSRRCAMNCRCGRARRPSSPSTSSSARRS